MAMPPGTRLGPYEIVAAIGAGGMGEVYKARDTRLQRDVAVKVLPGALTGDAAARERFLREARAVASLQHPNICTLHDVGETGDGSVFLVMELLHGETALQRAAQGPLEVATLVDAGIALADALETAHAAGIVHRDIKPANVVLTVRGPKILDFGVAQMRPAAPASSAHTALPDPQLTTPGTAVGTVAYMSPEQLQGDAVDARSDLFSLGLVLFELATGRPAFTGGTTSAIAAAILHHAPVAPSALRPGLPPRIDEVLLKALEKDRGLRYQTAAEIRADLQRLKRDSDAAAVMPSPPSRPAAHGFRQWPAMAAVASLLALGIAAVWAVYLRRPPPLLTDTATLVLADFVNTTGDAVFDDTLRQGLAVQLQQSPFLSLVSDQRIRQTLRLMGHAADAPLTGDAAREACERLGGGAMLEGSIASLGTQYVLGLRAERCGSGDVLAEEQVQAASKEDVLDALSRAASAFRTRVGESLTTIEQHNRPLEEASTPSLDALKAFSAAVKMMGLGQNASALFQRAIEIDPGFALAHARLGLRYSIMGESELGVRSTSEAYRLRDRATDSERFFITATYQRQVTGNLEAAQRTFETWGEMYPRDITPPALSSGFTYKGTGDYEKAIAQATRALTIDPDFAPAYINLVYCNLYLERFQEARKLLERAVARMVEPPDWQIARYLLAFLSGDRVAMDREVAAAQSNSEVGLLVQHTEALTSARSGQLQRARMLSRRAVEGTQKTGQHERAAVFQTGAAVWEAFYGNREGAHQAARDALRVSRGRDVVYGAAFALALTGEVAEAQTLADELAKRYPEDTSVQTQYLPTLRGLLALQRKDSAAAIVQLDAALPNELGIPATNFVALFGSLYSAYVRGQAFQALGRPAEAVAEFRKILDHSGLVFSDPVGAMARLHLARALAASGDRSGAHAAYEDLLSLWTAADANLPLAQQVKAEVAKLP